MNKIFNTKIWLLILAVMHTVMGIIVNYQQVTADVTDINTFNTENLAVFLIFGCVSIYLFYAALMTSGQHQARLATVLCLPFFFVFKISWMMELNLAGVPAAAMPEAILPFILWAMPAISGLINWNSND
tara:strand:+ start:952 stop:1338 length:387 start_codon:yes stop_codon:yes gene_type:complete